MSLEYAILGFLQYRPLSGYDLKKVFDTSVRHFWAADQSQIYRTLARLAEQGLAEVEVIEQEERPDRKVYHITEDGRNALARWLREPVTPGEPHSAPLVQVFFAGQLSDEEILALFRRYAGMLRAQLAHYEEVYEQTGGYRELVSSERERFFGYLTLESGIAMARSQLEWMESVIRRLEQKQVPA